VSDSYIFSGRDKGLNKRGGLRQNCRGAKRKTDQVDNFRVQCDDTADNMENEQVWSAQASPIEEKGRAAKGEKIKNGMPTGKRCPRHSLCERREKMNGK